MKIRSVQATETEGQLEDSLWRYIRVLAKKISKYFRKKDSEKVESLEEVLNLFHQIDGIMTQLTVKMINHSPVIAAALAREALTNKKKRSESVANLRRLDQVFGIIQEDAANKKLMANAVGNMANNQRKPINRLMQNTRSKLAQLIKSEKLEVTQEKQNKEMTTKQRQEEMYKGSKPVRQRRFGLF